MTHSTKQALVEHVARAIYENPTYEDGSLIFWRELPIEKREVVREDAKAAIRATLEWARDSVSEGMTKAGLEQHDSVGMLCELPDDFRGLFRAMLSALIQELDKGDGG